MLNPGMASDLSKVPPVWPSPLPEIFGTMIPSSAIRGAMMKEVLSPIPPLECLSMICFPYFADQSIFIPDSAMAKVKYALS